MIATLYHSNIDFSMLKPFDVVVHYQFTDYTELNQYRCKFPHSKFVHQFACKTFAFVPFWVSSVKLPIYFIHWKQCLCTGFETKIKASNLQYYEICSLIWTWNYAIKVKYSIWAMDFICGALHNLHCTHLNLWFIYAWIIFLRVFIS